jgi:hypothetical protein
LFDHVWSLLLAGLKRNKAPSSSSLILFIHTKSYCSMENHSPARSNINAPLMQPGCWNDVSAAARTNTCDHVLVWNWNINKYKTSELIIIPHNTISYSKYTYIYI